MSFYVESPPLPSELPCFGYEPNCVKYFIDTKGIVLELEIFDKNDSSKGQMKSRNVQYGNVNQES